MSAFGNEPYDVAGVGIGPFNLSLAALLHPLGLRTCFHEQKPAFEWHAGLLFPGSTLQVSHLKDLVTPIDPTSRFSFLAFLAAHKRLYRFINADFPRVSRREFTQYFRWVSESLPGLEFGSPVQAVEFDGSLLRVSAAAGSARARNVVLGTGLAPLVPPCAGPHLGASVFHASGLLSGHAELGGGRVVLVGGGQTGSELALYVLALQGDAAPAEVHWVTRRTNLLPLDETAFTNEMFTPAFCEHFFGLPLDVRLRLLEQHKLAGNGVAPALLQQLYRRMYEIEFLEGRGRAIHFHLGYEMVGLERDGAAWRLTLRDRERALAPRQVTADTVVLCTGWENGFPACLEPLRPRVSWSGGEFAVNRDFSIEWDGPASTRIYVQNAGRRSHGVAEPNLSIMAWRSATIINSLAGRRVYDVSDPHTVFQWDDATPLTQGAAR